MYDKDSVLCVDGFFLLKEQLNANVVLKLKMYAKKSLMQF